MKRSPKYRPRLSVWVDGGCRPNPGKGAAASLIEMDGQVSFRRTQFKAQTTNSEMELIAMIQGLISLKVLSDSTGQNYRATIYSDSTYIITGITLWLKNWKKHDFTGNKGKPVANKDLWIFLDQVITDLTSQGTRLKFEHIKGHSGNYYNEMVDKMCTQVILKNS